MDKKKKSKTSKRKLFTHSQYKFTTYLHVKILCKTYNRFPSVNLHSIFKKKNEMLTISCLFAHKALQLKCKGLKKSE